MNTKNALNQEQVDKIIDVLKLSNEDAQIIFENATAVSCKRDPHVQYEINISFANENNARILIDASYYDNMRLFLDSYDKKSFYAGQFINQADGYDFLKTKLKELSQLDGPVLQNKEYLLSTALRLDKDEVSAFTSDVSDIKVLHQRLDIQLEDDRNIRLYAPDSSKDFQEYNISISDNGEKVRFPTFTDNEYTFRVLKEIKNMPISEIEENLSKFADGERTFVLSKALGVDERTIEGFSQRINDFEIYEFQDKTTMKFELEDTKVMVKIENDNFAMFVDGKHVDSFPDGKYIAAELEELADKLEHSTDGPKHDMENANIDFD